MESEEFTLYSVTEISLGGEPLCKNEWTLVTADGEHMYRQELISLVDNMTLRRRDYHPGDIISLDGDELDENLERSLCSILHSDVPVMDDEVRSEAEDKLDEEFAQAGNVDTAPEAASIEL